MFECHRKLAKDYYKKACPLTWLPEKSMVFVWGKEDEEAWQVFKDELVRAPILAYPDSAKDFIL